MRILRQGYLRHAFFLLIASLGLGLAGCEGDDGLAGSDGTNGVDGADGAAGQACWDLNNNGVGDPDEDINGDGVIDVYDCNAYASGAYEISQLHVGYFTEHTYEGTSSCLNCHGKLGDEFLTTAHWKWEGTATNILGQEGDIEGKNTILNNFCVAVPTNEGRCAQCHAGYGYNSPDFDFGNPDNIDCLVCHDQTNTYAKAPTTAGLPDPSVDLQAVARSVALNSGEPTIDNCIFCHANAGGGDNVKHGDIAMVMADTTREFDVHMGTDGADLECIACHQVARDTDGNMLSHGIGGMPFHSVDEGVMRQCDDCHGDRLNIHVGSSVELIVGSAAHERLACQVCHIPTFARQTPTKTLWNWADAGQDIDPIPTDPVTGKPTYAKKKGTFAWANNVRPTLRYFNGKWTKFTLGDGLPDDTDVYDTVPVVLGAPVGDHLDDTAMIYPFKKMVGNQVADIVNQRIMVPHLFGMAAGPNPYWVAYDWDLALLDASAVTGQPYTSGDFGFVDTEMYLTVNHEVAPAAQAYGMDGDCTDCHTDNQIEWTALGWTADPLAGGSRP